MGRTDPGGLLARRIDALGASSYLRDGALAGLVERKGRGVDAIPKPRRFRPVGKDMPEMAVAPGAQNLGPRHEEAPVLLRPDILRRDRLRENRPPGPPPNH